MADKAPRKRARKQASEIVIPEYVQANGDYNIWYHKRLGDPPKRTDASTHRCDPEKDTGLTKANSAPGRHYLCVYFARGKCVHGHKCQFFHRLPRDEDLKAIPMTRDIFGRERHATDRDDMGGTGNFNRENRTLYIGGLKNSRTTLEKTLKEEFGKYGEVEYVRIINSQLIAFVRFANRIQAEFAKEAMSDQVLAKGELLNVRWANEDPNPTAKRYEDSDLNRRAAEGIMDRSKAIGIPEYMLEQHQAPESVSHPYAKLQNGGKGTDKDAAAGMLSTQQQYYLQWAQFFAQQGIDPSQLDEKTILYYQQYYSSYFYGNATAYGQTTPSPAITNESTDKSEEVEEPTASEEKTEEKK